MVFEPYGKAVFESSDERVVVITITYLAEDAAIGVIDAMTSLI
jgi:hypothetical protein